MNEQQLDRSLRSVGKECFVTFFGEFCDGTRSNESVDAQIREERGYTWEACRTRTSKSRSIIKAGRAEEALIICSKANVSAHIKQRAAVLAADLRGRSQI